MYLYPGFTGLNISLNKNSEKLSPRAWLDIDKSTFNQKLLFTRNIVTMKVNDFIWTSEQIYTLSETVIIADFHQHNKISYPVTPIVSERPFEQQSVDY
jgi:hypothetical protein